MIIGITGAGSGLGLAITSCLRTQSAKYQLITIDRSCVDLSDITSVLTYQLPVVDIFINCAGTGRGGKICFTKHHPEYIAEILNTNLLSPVLLSQKALITNPNCKIVNITSTNNNRFWPGDLAYSLSKSALSDFGKMLREECPDANILEVRLGLTKTNFNQNRYKDCKDRFQELYNRPHLFADVVAKQVCDVLFDNNIKFLEISP